MSAIHNIWPRESGILDIEGDWKDLCASEVMSIRDVWRKLRDDLTEKKLIKEFSEKLCREWAIETGIIENLYDIDRGVTLTLIEHGFHAEFIGHGDTNKPRDYVLTLLRDQKNALEGVFDFVAQRRRLSTSYIKELHAALVRSQSHTEAVDSHGRAFEAPLISGDWKQQPNYPTRDGTIYKYCPPEHVAAEMDRLIVFHQRHIDCGVTPEVAAAWLHHRFTQIHPFQDGNGRVARALASLVLVQADLFPLVVTRDDRVDYITALEAADAGDLRPLVDLIAKLQRTQFRRATAISENVLSEDVTADQLLQSLIDEFDDDRSRRKVDFKRVFEISTRLQDDLLERFEHIAPMVRLVLQKKLPSADARIVKSQDDNSHWFRSQIIKNAKENLRYYANTRDYAAWVSLGLYWDRRAKLVFAFHAIGTEFNGSLVCAPFLEFRDQDDDGEPSTTMIPLAEEPFVFFYNETPEAAISRFRPWRENVIKIAMQELKSNL